MKLMDLSHSQVLEERDMAHLAKVHEGGAPREWDWPSRWEPWTSVFTGDQAGVQQRQEKISLVCLNVKESQSREGKRGACDRDQLYQWLHLVPWSGCSQVVCGNVEISKKKKKKIWVLMKYTMQQDFSSLDVCTKIEMERRKEWILEIEKCSLW